MPREYHDARNLANTAVPKHHSDDAYTACHSYGGVVGSIARFHNSMDDWVERAFPGFSGSSQG